MLRISAERSRAAPSATSNRAVSAIWNQLARFAVWGPGVGSGDPDATGPPIGSFDAKAPADSTASAACSMGADGACPEGTGPIPARRDSRRSWSLASEALAAAVTLRRACRSASHQPTAGGDVSFRSNALPLRSDVRALVTKTTSWPRFPRRTSVGVDDRPRRQRGARDLRSSQGQTLQRCRKSLPLRRIRCRATHCSSRGCRPVRLRALAGT
jgi:hypothetical protein